MFNKSKIYTSYGIACVRKYNNKYELLMIQKKTSYSFIEFIRGLYDPYRYPDISYMFDNMTIDEKSAINTLDFNIVWFRAFNRLPIASDRSRFNKGEKKFNLLKNIKNGLVLKDLIAKSSSIELLWEIPKGRMDKGETDLISAVREFEEETNISKDKYRILFNESTISYTFTDNGVRYKYVYFLAVANNKLIPQYDYNNSHMTSEISNIRFLSSEYIRALNNNRLYKISKIIIKKCKQYIV
jgi:8-oxo-dGTP pyrophosphatase MutT (NUDIX family)